MARKNTTTHPLIREGSLAAMITSEEITVTTLDQASIRINWTSTDAVGEFKLQARQKTKQDEILESSPWFDVDFGSTISIDMTQPTPDTEHQLILTQLPFDQIRLVYTSTAGTGTVDARITAKQVGG